MLVIFNWYQTQFKTYCFDLCAPNYNSYPNYFLFPQFNISAYANQGHRQH